MISIIAIISKNRGIGCNNRLLWHIPEDFRRFKNITTGHPVIMGRRTYESIGKALPNRSNIIITRDAKYKAEHCFIANSLEDAIKIANYQIGNEEVFIIGGGQIYEQAMPIADKLYITLVDEEMDADTFFPDYSAFGKIIKEETFKNDQLKYTFWELTRS